MKETADVMTEALSEALETMAFCSVDPLDEDTVVPSRLVLVEMDYNGPKRGHLQILGGWELGRQLAENIGCLEAVDDESIVDAWKEICNVISGLVIPVIADSQADIYDITVPVATLDERAPSWEEFTALADTRIVNVEGCAVATRLRVWTSDE